MQFLLSFLLTISQAIGGTWLFYPTQSTWSNLTAVDFGSGNTTKYISMGDNWNFPWTDDFTLCAWHYPHSAYDHPIFTRENGSTSNGWDFRYTSGNKYQFYSSGSGATRRIQVITTNTYSAGTWRHVCFVYSGNQSATGISIVIDGSSVALTTQFNTSTEDWSVASINAYLGKWENLTTYARAKMDEVTVWNDNLSTSEIAELISAGKPANPAVSSMWATKNLNYYRMGDLTDSTSSIVDRGNVGGVNGTPTSFVSGDFVSSVP